MYSVELLKNFVTFSFEIDSIIASSPVKLTNGSELELYCLHILQPVH